LVRVVDRIPVTTWYRPITSSLREEGIPPVNTDFPVFYRGPRADAYRPLTEAAHRRLAGENHAGAAESRAQAGSVSPE
jgi:putative long chain acyl-CoA synthase